MFDKLTNLAVEECSGVFSLTGSTGSERTGQHRVDCDKGEKSVNHYLRK